MLSLEEEIGGILSCWGNGANSQPLTTCSGAQLTKVPWGVLKCRGYTFSLAQ